MWKRYFIHSMYLSSVDKYLTKNKDLYLYMVQLGLVCPTSTTFKRILPHCCCWEKLDRICHCERIIAFHQKNSMYFSPIQGFPPPLPTTKLPLPYCHHRPPMPIQPIRSSLYIQPLKLKLQRKCCASVLLTHIN